MKERMQRHHVLVMAIFFVLMCITPSLGAEFQKLSDAVYVNCGETSPSPANSFGSNQGVVIGDRDVLVVDAFSTPSEAKKTIDFIKSVTPKPIRYLVLTHFHFDHSIGAKTFTDIGALMIAHENFRPNMERTAENITGFLKSIGYTDEMIKGVSVVYPNFTFSKTMNIDLGGITVNLVYVDKGHSPDNILVFVPSEHLVFTGDILFKDYHAYLGAADVPGWKNNLDYLIASGVEKAVPGHGPLASKMDFVEQKDYITLFDAKAKELLAVDADIDKAAAELASILPKRPIGAWMIKSSLALKYGSVKKK